MALDIDSILDRRALRRKVSFWRIGALIAIACAVIAFLSSAGAFKGVKTPRDHIARVEISGAITSDRPLLKMLKEIEEDDGVKAVVLSINSPGGTTVGGEAIFEAVRRISEKKPVVSSVKTLAASAGYMIASASDHIIARRSSIVGSIGVIVQYPQFYKALDKIGIAVKEIKSSPLKAEPSPFHESPPGAEAVIKELIDDSYNWFVDLVTARRPLTRAEVLLLADGRVFSGDRALKNKLIDGIGGEQEAQQWLVSEKNIDKELELLDWKPRREKATYFPFLASLGQWFDGKSATSFKDVDVNDLPAFVPKRLFLDGLLSIWHN